MILFHGQVMSKVYMFELNFYLSRTIGARFWCTQSFPYLVSNSNLPHSCIHNEQWIFEFCLVRLKYKMYWLKNKWILRRMLNPAGLQKKKTLYKTVLRIPSPPPPDWPSPPLLSILLIVSVTVATPSILFLQYHKQIPMQLIPTSYHMR